jgi:hypothetical protein
MKLFSAAAFLSIVMISTTGMEDAFAACTTQSSCFLSCMDEFPDPGDVAGNSVCRDRCGGFPRYCVTAQGRVKTDTPVPKPSICEAAEKARARNSPAAPGLEAKCRAAAPASDAAMQDNADAATRNRQERRDAPR